MDFFKKVVACMIVGLFPEIIVDPVGATTVLVSEIAPEVKVEFEELGIDVNLAELQTKFSEAAIMIKVERT